jgi:hypothetical protein
MNVITNASGPYFLLNMKHKTMISAIRISIAFNKDVFFEPILSIIYPTIKLPMISPNPNDTIANIDNSNYSPSDSF